LAFQFAGAKSLDGVSGLRRRFLPPRFDATLAQQTFEHFLLVRRQRFGVGQDAYSAVIYLRSIGIRSGLL